MQNSSVIIQFSTWRKPCNIQKKTTVFPVLVRCQADSWIRELIKVAQRTHSKEDKADCEKLFTEEEHISGKQSVVLVLLLRFLRRHGRFKVNFLSWGWFKATSVQRSIHHSPYRSASILWPEHCCSYWTACLGIHGHDGCLRFLVHWKEPVFARLLQIDFTPQPNAVHGGFI